MRFTFRFEALLTYRAHLKERAEVALGRARQSLRTAQEGFKALQTRQRESFCDFSSLLKGRAESERLRSYVEFLNALQGRIEIQAREVEKRQQQVRVHMKDVVERTKQYRIIEKLKEKEYETWRHEQNLLEQKALDESAAMRHGRVFL
jgi:flagellar FliJ protein